MKFTQFAASPKGPSQSPENHQIKKGSKVRRSPHNQNPLRLINGPEKPLHNNEREIIALRANVERLTALNALQEQEIKDLTRKNEHLKALADHDALTGLPNRRAFIEELDRVKALYEREKMRTYSLVAFDLDGFKAVNDTYGHEAGDECLKLVGEELQKVIRGSDFLAREGGDEFVVILPNTDESNARAVGEKVLHTIEEQVTLRLKERGYNSKVSASIGVLHVSCEDNHDISKEMLLKLADYTRYVVKAAGKGAVLTLDEARLCDTDKRHWKSFVSSQEEKNI
jgi:diguanylate cyclase (GGDEF)-like protein